MVKKSSHSHALYIILGIIVAAVLIVGVAYFYGTQNKEQVNVLATADTSKASAVSSEAIAKCVDNGGFVTTSHRGSWGYYSICNFADDMTCDLFALYDGDCQVGGVQTVGYTTTAQVFCAQRGGTPQGNENGECKMPDGKICSTSAVHQGTCE